MQDLTCEARLSLSDDWLIQHHPGDGDNGIGAWSFTLKAARQQGSTGEVALRQLAEDAFDVETGSAVRSIPSVRQRRQRSGLLKYSRL